MSHVAPLLIPAGVMVWEGCLFPITRLAHPTEDEDDRNREPDDDTPETPLDEPQPPRVEDPPAEPEQKGPFVVSAW